MASLRVPVGSWFTLPTAKECSEMQCCRAIKMGLGSITRGHAVPKQRVIVVATAVVSDSGAHLQAKSDGQATQVRGEGGSNRFGGGGCADVEGFQGEGGELGRLREGRPEVKLQRAREGGAETTFSMAALRLVT
jgi:hypothetical protein